MHEREFEQRYAAYQRRIKAPADLIAATYAATQHMAEAADNKHTDAQHTPCNPTFGKQPLKKVQTRRESEHARRHPRWHMAMAACLAFALVVAGGAAAWRMNGAALTPLFAVKAYAAATDQVFEDQNDIIVFPIDKTTSEYAGEGGAGNIFSGVLFTLQGEGIERMQATLSRGELYTYTLDDFLIADAPEKAQEASAWKPTLAGSGTYYSAWDKVVRLGGQYDRKNDPYAHVRMMKRLGSTIDMPIKQGENNCWGLWLDISYGDETIADKDGYIPAVDVDFSAMDGQTLTVTAQFENGRAQTQVIELHDGWFATTAAQDGARDARGANNVADTLPVGAPLSDEVAHKTPGAVYTLYGKVVATTNDAHPYSLDKANEYADVLAPNPEAIEGLLEKRDPILTIDATPGADRIHAANESLPFTTWNFPGEDAQPERVVCAITNISAYATDVLPAEFDLYTNTEVLGFQGNIDYMNRCRILTSGWTVSPEGKVNDANSFVVVEYDVTNTSGFDYDLAIEGAAGELCSVDSASSKTTFACGGIFAASASGWHDASNTFDDARRWVRISLGATVRVKAVFIADNRVAQAEEVFYVPLNVDLPAEGDGSYDLSKMDFVSLGKLGRR